MLAFKWQNKIIIVELLKCISNFFDECSFEKIKQLKTEIIFEHHNFSLSWK